MLDRRGGVVDVEVARALARLERLRGDWNSERSTYCRAATRTNVKWSRRHCTYFVRIQLKKRFCRNCAIRTRVPAETSSGAIVAARGLQSIRCFVSEPIGLRENRVARCRRSMRRALRAMLGHAGRRATRGRRRIACGVSSWVRCRRSRSGCRGGPMASVRIAMLCRAGGLRDGDARDCFVVGSARRWADDGLLGYFRSIRADLRARPHAA